MLEPVGSLNPARQAVHSFVSLERCREFVRALAKATAAFVDANRAGLRDFAFVAGTALAFGAAIILGTVLTREAGNASAIWPANGILCAALLSTSRAHLKYAVLLLSSLTNFAVMMQMGDVLFASLAFAIINPAEALLTCALIQRLCPAAINFTHGRSLLKFSFVAGFLGPLLPSIAGAYVIHAAYGADFLTVFRTWFFADALGLLIFIPAVSLLFDKDEYAQQHRSRLELCVLFFALCTASVVVFSQTSFPLLFVIPAIIVRIAFRLGPSYTAAAAVTTALFAVTYTAAGMGPAALVPGNQMLLRMEVIQIFILVAFYTALPAATAFAEQSRLRRGLDYQIAARDALSMKLEHSAALLESAVGTISMGLCLYDEKGRVLLSNEQFAKVYNLSPSEITPGMTLSEVIDLRIANGLFAGENAEQYWAERLNPVTNDSRLIHHLNDGRSIAISQRPLPGGGWVTTQEDISEIRSIEQRLAFLAHHDPLTGLANRALLHDRIELALTRVRRGEHVAVLFLDLDHFKSVNDTYGHAAGDELLTIVAERLRSGLRESDTLARLGGDEFAILLVAAEQPAGAGVVARRIEDLMHAPFMIGGKQIRIGTSIGIATAPHDANTTLGLLKCADLALYKAKAEGRGTHRFFETEMDRRMLARQALEQDLRIAVAESAFSLHYQPLVDLATGQVTCFEALIRWDHDDRGMVSPADFIPVAEETGLIISIGTWVLKKACEDAARWPDHIKVAVNLARAQLMSPGLVEKIAAVLAESGLRPGRLSLKLPSRRLCRTPQRPSRFSTLCGRWALTSPWTISERGTHRSAVCAVSPSARSRSIGLSSAI